LPSRYWRSIASAEGAGEDADADAAEDEDDDADDDGGAAEMGAGCDEKRAARDGVRASEAILRTDVAAILAPKGCKSKRERCW
jgi:hypothetical protein